MLKFHRVLISPHPKLQSEKNSDSLVGSIVISLTLLIVGYVLQILTNHFLTHHLTLHQYGFYSTCIATISMVGTIILLGNDEASVRFLPKYLAAKSNNYLLGLLIYYVYLIGIIYILLLSIAFMTKHFSIAIPSININDENHLIINYLWVIPFFALFSFLCMVLRGLGKVYPSTIYYYVGMPFSYLLFLNAFYFTHHSTLTLSQSIDSFFYAILLTSVVEGLSVFKFFHRYVNQNVIAKYRIKYWGIVAILFLASVTLFYLQQFLVTLLLKATHNSPEIIGVYNIIFLIANSMFLIAIACTAVISPLITPIAQQGNTAVLQKFANIVFLISFASSIICFVFFVCFGKALLHLFGNEYVSGYEALLLLVFSNSLGLINNMPMLLLQFAGHPASLAKTAIFGFTIAIIMGFFLCKFFGLLGAVATTIFLEAEFLILFSYLIKKRLSLHLFAFRL